jgi:hypothetical protein
MTNSPDPQSSPRTPLGFDELVAIFVALSAIGAILFWSLSRRDGGLPIPSILSSSPSANAPSMTPTPEATASPTPVVPLFPPVVPPESPQALSPVPSTTPARRQVPAIIPFPITTPQTPATAQPINFIDVPQDFWAYPFITALASRGIVNGFPGGYFKPTDPVTRAEFAALLQEAFGQNPGRDNVAVFKDVSPNFWAVPAIDRAIQTGFLRGYPDNTFQPQQEIPRAQVLVALASGLNLTPPSSPAEVLQVYTDVAQIPNYATQKVAAATTTGLVSNYPDPKLLNPNQNATRADVAAMIYQALVRAGRVEPIQSQYIVSSPQAPQ